MKTVFFSHRGNRKKGNEDALLALGCLVAESSMERPAMIAHDARDGLFAVVDGMGGYEGGALAARITALSLKEGLSVEETPDEDCLRALFVNTAQQMSVEAEKSPLLSSMGATLAGLLLREGQAFAFNCGDCRVYRFRGGYLDRISRDHSIVQELLDRGEIEEAEMGAHPSKNIVTSAVQANIEESGISVFLRELPYNEGDAFFLCSDGVWEALPVEELEECLGREDMIEGCAELSRRLLGSACRDNVTYIFIKL